MVTLRLVILLITFHTAKGVPTEHKQRVLQGERVTIQCRLDNCLHSSWYFDRSGIDIRSFPEYNYSQVTNGLCNLNISNVSLYRDDGDWQCYKPRSSNSIAISSNVVTKLEVEIESSPPKILYNKTVLEDTQVINPAFRSRLTLECITEYGKPESIIYWLVSNSAGNVVWLRGKFSVEQHEESKLLRTSNFITLPINETMDNMTLTCHSKFYNKTNTVSCRLNITYATTNAIIKERGFLTLKENQRFSLVCEANGNPQPKYQWRFKRKNNVKWNVISTEAVYTFTVGDDTVGNYMCYAGNMGDFSAWSQEETIEMTENPTTLDSITIASLACCVGLTAFFSILLVMYLKVKQIRNFERAVENNKESNKPSVAVVVDFKPPGKNEDDMALKSLPEVQLRKLPQIRETSNSELSSQNTTNDAWNRERGGHLLPPTSAVPSEDPHGYLPPRNIRSVQYIPRDLDPMPHDDQYVPHDPDPMHQDSSRDSGVSNIYEDVYNGQDNAYENAEIRKDN